MNTGEEVPLGFLVDKGGGLDPIWMQMAQKRAPEVEEVDTRTELEKERDWNRKTAIAVGVIGALPWALLGMARIFWGSGNTAILFGLKPALGETPSEEYIMREMIR